MDEWSNMSNSAQRKAINSWSEAKPQLDGARDRRGIYSVPDGDPECEETKNNTSRKMETRRAQRCLAKSPNRPTRTVQAGSDPVQVIGFEKKKRKD